MTERYRFGTILSLLVLILTGCYASKPKMSLDYTPTNWLHQESFEVVDTIGNYKFGIYLVIVTDQTDTTKYLLESIFESYHNYDLSAPYQSDSQSLEVTNYNVIIGNDTLDVHIGENEETTINRKAGNYIIKARRKLTHYQLSEIPDSVTVNFDIAVKNNDGTILQDEHKLYLMHPQLVQYDILPPRFIENPSNPFSPTNNVSYNLRHGTDVLILINNFQGQIVDTLVNGFREAGNHTEIWGCYGFDNKTLPTGIYFIKIQTEFGTVTRKTVLLK
ncbi:MAG: hypothetical protein KAR42_11705 [candidate division Zixibacteria bacterium]|nr:hypothetical protein [candidate division Zixibacteria bacterium]